MLILVLWLWCAPAIAQSSDYTEIYAHRLQQLQERIETLRKYVNADKFVDVRAYIRGPLGEIRRDIAYLAMGLRGEAMKQAKQLGKAIADDLVKLDVAAKEFNSQKTEDSYLQVKADFNKLLEILPKQ
ncbi:MAG: photosystem II protein PsbQ [Pseudanabaenaceae cyanobacterium]